MAVATKQKEKQRKKRDRDAHRLSVDFYPVQPTATKLPGVKWPTGSMRWPFIILAILAALVVGWLARDTIAELMVLITDQEAVSTHVRGFGAWGPLVLALAQMVQVLIAFIPGHVFVIAGGYVYGFPAGFALNLACVVTASQLAYSLARWAGRPVVNRLAPPEQLDKWEKIAEKQGFMFFTIAFILPVFPTDAMNFVAGLSGLSPRRFLAANVLGRLPHSIVLTLIGSHGLELSPVAWGILVIAVAAVYITGRFAIIRIERRYSRSGPTSSAT